MRRPEGILLNDPNRVGGLTANIIDRNFMILLCNIMVVEISLSGVVLVLIHLQSFSEVLGQFGNQH